MLEVRENEIALRKLFCGTAQLYTLEGTLCAAEPVFWWRCSFSLVEVWGSKATWDWRKHLK